MTDNNHPITPPPELVEQWECEYHHMTYGPDLSIFISEKAARWGADQQLKLDIEQVNRAWQKGADQELEACCEWLRSSLPGYDKHYADYLHAARRPKPPSLKEQALTQLDSLHADLKTHGLGTNTDTIRRALEQLND